MRFVSSVGVRTLALLAGCAALLSGCSNDALAPAQAPGAPAVRALWSPGNLLFVSDARRNDVRIYDRSSNAPWETIPNVPRPRGLAVDASNNLYVANLSGVSVYPPPYMKPSAQLALSWRQAVAVAVSANGMIAAVSARDIFLFPANSQKPCTDYAPANYSQLTSIAFDSNNNVYFSGTTKSGAAQISEMVADCSNVSSAQLTIGNTLHSAGGLAIGSDGRLSVLDTRARTIFTYDPPVDDSLGVPVSTTLLDKGTVRTPVAFVFDSTGKSILTADSTSGMVDQFAFPTGGAPTGTTMVGGDPVGVAIVPPYLPKAH
ncbi:MAG TPA: hypothetical protein VGF18_04220 [Candidatus Tumulicola sp.]